MTIKIYIYEWVNNFNLILENWEVLYRKYNLNYTLIIIIG